MAEGKSWEGVCGHRKGRGSAQWLGAEHWGEGCRDGTWAVTKEAWEVKSDGDDNPRLPCGRLD